MSCTQRLLTRLGKKITRISGLSVTGAAIGAMFSTVAAFGVVNQDDPTAMNDVFAQLSAIEKIFLSLLTGVTIGGLGGFLGGVYEEFCCCCWRSPDAPKMRVMEWKPEDLPEEEKEVRYEVTRRVPGRRYVD